MIRAAAIRAEGHLRRTPMLESDGLNRLAGRRVLVKAECLQHTGSFKARGGWAALSAMKPDARGRGVIAFSSGNHAQGVARAAAAFGAPCVIVMPSDAPAVKIANTRALGAEIVLYDRATEDRDAIAAPIAEARGLTLIKPFDDPQVIAGQGTTGLEIAVQAAEAGVTFGRRADVLRWRRPRGRDRSGARGRRAGTARPNGRTGRLRRRGALSHRRRTARKSGSLRLDLRRDPDADARRADVSGASAPRRSRPRRDRFRGARRDARGVRAPADRAGTRRRGRPRRGAIPRRRGRGRRGDRRGERRQRRRVPSSPPRSALRAVRAL